MKIEQVIKNNYADFYVHNFSACLLTDNVRIYICKMQLLL